MQKAKQKLLILYASAARFFWSERVE